MAAKNKLGFVDGSIEEPEKEPERGKWRRVDEMVSSWIINSMSNEIAETFVYCTSARRLWQELEEQFGEINGPQIYQIQRQIASIEQGGQSVVMYYSRLKRLWEELNILQPLPQCTCSMAGTFSTIASQNKLIQFLMGLNESYDPIRSQILVLDPLPTVSKAFSMVQRVEKQRSVQVDLVSNTEGNVLMVKGTQYSNTKGGNNSKKNQRKEDKVCEHCKATGHEKDTCFKLHGYPDWYKQLKKNKAAASGKGYAHMAVYPFEEEDVERRKDTKHSWSPAMAELVQQEIAKMLKGMQITGGEQVNFAQTEDFAGNLTAPSLSFLNDKPKHWVIDTRATNHICTSRSLFSLT